MNKAEEFTYNICKQSFLSMWSYKNPRGKKGKELCDVLIVCDPDVIVISVKDCEFKKSGNLRVDWDRWIRNAINESAKQIYGAERLIESTSHVIRKNGKEGLVFPTPEQRRIHRVAVALGGRGEVPIHSGELGKGFVHVFTEASFKTILEELDTITDFVTYLIDKELWLDSIDKLIVVGGENNLLAKYLLSDRKFPSGANVVFLDDSHWDALQKDTLYRNKKREDKISYIWDDLIEHFSGHMLNDTLEFGSSLNENEMLVRVMARESRFDRRVLGKAFREFMKLSRKQKWSRIVPSPSGIVYVFLASPRDEDRDYRRKELTLRCFVARGLHRDSETVIGIGTEQYDAKKGFTLDGVYLQHEQWTDKDDELMRQYQQEFHLFSDVTRTQQDEKEYPLE